MTQLETPVAFLVFNRPATTRRVFAAISNARPSRLFLIADGARSDRPGEAQLCDEVRRIISAVDWPCQVETNRGTAITWARFSCAQSRDMLHFRSCVWVA